MLRVKALGDLEAEAMELVWQLARPVTVRELLVEFNCGRQLAYTTVMTVMHHLYSKGWLVREMVSRAYVYSAATTREQYSAQVMESALVASANSGATLVHFVEVMSPDEIAALRVALSAATPTQASVGHPAALRKGS